MKSIVILYFSFVIHRSDVVKSDENKTDFSRLQLRSSSKCKACLRHYTTLQSKKDEDTVLPSAQFHVKEN